MKNILNEKDYSEIKDRIEKLSAANIRRWGKWMYSKCPFIVPHN